MKYWIKLYHEILNDRKIATLPDNLWRRCVECFLIAGEEENDGFLPTAEDIAFRLRMDAETIRRELEELSKTGIIADRNGRYFVCNFSKRQDAMPKKEYMHRKRKTEKLQNYYQNDDDASGNDDEIVTDGNKKETQIRLDKIRLDKIKEDETDESPTIADEWIAEQEEPENPRENKKFSPGELIQRSWSVILGEWNYSIPKEAFYKAQHCNPISYADHRVVFDCPDDETRQFMAGRYGETIRRKMIGLLDDPDVSIIFQNGSK